MSQAEDKLGYANRLAVLFYKLLELPLESGDKEDKCTQWAKDFVRLLDVYSFEDLKKILRWALKEDSFWPTRLFVSKNVVNNIDRIASQWKAQAKVATKLAQKKDPSVGCTCPRDESGQIKIHNDKITVYYDFDCPRHGHYEIPNHRYQIFSSKGILSIPPSPPAPPRFGQPGFPDHIKALKKVLPKPRKREEVTITKLPVLAKNQDLSEI